MKFFFTHDQASALPTMPIVKSMRPPAMTYEEKMLIVFARYRGEALTPELITKIEGECTTEVWAHLPPSIQQKWMLHLALSDNGHIELRPEQLKPGGAEELETVLKTEFVEQLPYTSVSLSFSGDVHSAVQAGVVTQFSVEKNEKPLVESKNTTQVKQGETSIDSKKSATEIAEQAKELGIALPPNSSLLGPFLEALNVATAYKKRADEAEARLAEFARLSRD